MPRIATAKDLIKHLQSRGWVVARKTASHWVFKHPARADNIIVPGGHGINLKLIKWILSLARTGGKRVMQ